MRVGSTSRMRCESSILTLTGLPTARGFAAGPVFIFRGDDQVPILEYLIEPGTEGDEVLRLQRARNETKRDLENLISVLRQRTGKTDVMVFECHLMILEDPLLCAETERSISEDRLNAEAAVRKTADLARAQFERMNDPYFRERVRDLNDVERRLLTALTGFSNNPYQELKQPSIIVADELTPSETVRLPRELVLGFATNGGSTTSHVALLARAMGIPAVSGLGNVTEQVKAGETVLLDGTNGLVTLRPDDASVRAFNDLIARQKALAGSVSSETPAGTLKDGGSILVFANHHHGVPINAVRDFGARGIGLYRSEYLWLNRELEPTEEEQFEAYRDVAVFCKSLGPKASVTIRALDIGGDKLVRGISTTEANPFLGNRSIRYLLSHREVFETQLRAVLRASAFGPVCLMYPMVSCVEELREAAKILDGVKARLTAEGEAFDPQLPVGAMIEVPAAALNAAALAKYVKFFSIGTNDLVQYAMAADRGNEMVAHLYQPLNPAVLKLIRMTVAAAKNAGIYVGVCGESASDPVAGVLWAALGVDILSMSATYIPAMAKLFANLTRADLVDYAAMVETLSDTLTGQEIYVRCHDWLSAKIPDLDSIIL